MPVVSGSTVLVANTRSANVIVGSLEEFVTRPSLLRLAAITSAQPALAKLVVGRTVLIDDQNIVATGTSVAIPDHVMAEHTALRGRIALTFLSTGTPTILWRLDVLPVR